MMVTGRTESEKTNIRSSGPITQYVTSESPIRNNRMSGVAELTAHHPNVFPRRFNNQESGLAGSNRM